MTTMEELKTAVNAMKAIDQVREMVRERDKIRKTVRTVAIAAGVAAVVCAGAYAIYRFVVRRNEEWYPEDFYEDDDECPCICKDEKSADTCGCADKQTQETAQGELEEAVKEN